MNSIKDNLNFVITQNCVFGTSKHSDKNNNANRDHTKIYSLEDSRGLRDTVKNLCNYLKETHPEITKAKQLNKDIIQEWIDFRSKNWSNRTKECHKSHMEKINRLVCKEFKSCKNLDFTTGLNYNIVSHKKEDKHRDIEMSRDDLELLKESFRHSRSEAGLGLLLSETLGLRALEVVNFKTSYIDLENKKIILPASIESGTKGARGREIIIQDRYYNFFEHLINLKGYNHERLINIDEDSYNRTIRRHLEKLDLSEKYENTTNHSIRKLWAHELYNSYIEKGYPDSLDTFNLVSSQLGHGENRSDLYKVYICK